MISQKSFSIWAPSERQKDEVHRVSLSGFATWKFATKKDFNPQKKMYL